MGPAGIPAEDKETHTSRAVILSVGATVVLLFALTTFLNGAYRAARRGRAEARYQAGVALAARGQNEQAVEDFRAALVYEHDDPVYRFALAKSLLGLKRWNEAENYLLELRAEDPTSGPVNVMLARIADDDQRDDEAISNYHRAIFGFWPEHPEENRIAARFELISVLERDHRQKQVLAELLDLAGEVPESDLATHSKVAAMLLQQGSPQHAAEVYRAILAAHPRDASAEEGLGDSEFALGDFAAAHRAFDAAARYGAPLPGLAPRLALTNSILELDPTLVRLTATQRYQRAREILRRVVDASAGCSAIPPDLSDAAQKTLTQSSRRVRDGETAAMLTQAQKIWRARTASCPRQPVTDRPLAILMSKTLNQ